MSADEPGVDPEKLTGPTGRCCCMPGPDGYLVAVGHATGLVDSRLAEQAPAGREAGRDDGR
jgi:hypothetical protein